MPRSKKTNETLTLPEIKPGAWRGEIVGSGSVSFGQEVQEGPPRQAVEFTHIILPASLVMPDARFVWPGVVMILTPTPLKTVYPDAGRLMKSGDIPALTLSLNVTRGQFSDMLRMLEGKRLKDFHFTVEDGADGSWPVRSWGMAAGWAQHPATSPASN